MAETAAKQPLHILDIEPETWYENTDREIHGRALCDVGGPSKVGVGLIDFPSGSNTRPAHYHTREEEHLYVIEGAMTLCLGDRKFHLKAGNYVCFPAGKPLAHYLENESAEPCRYLMIGERVDGDEVVYPDEAKKK